MVVSKGSIPLQALGYYIPFITSFINNMRKIEREMIQAIIDQRDWKKANMRVERECLSSRVYLHDNHIATHWDNGLLFITDAGWKTNTTKSRLNSLIQFVHGGLAGLFQKKYNWHIRLPLKSGDTQDFEWFGNPIHVESLV